MDSAAAIAVDSVLHKIQALLEDESLAESMPAFGRNMAGIQSSLESMKQSFVTTQLVDHPPGSPIWTWMRDLRERAYDVEDQIDRFMIANGSPPSPSVRLQKHGFKGLLQRTNDLLSNVKARRRLSGDIQKHKDHVLQLHAVLPSLAASPSTRRTDDVDCGSSSVHNTPIQALAAGEVTVGLDGPRDELIKLLMVMESESESESESAARLKVVSVVGSGGMGKTTLTQHVYSTIGPHFHCRAWVVVSQMNIREILTDLLRQVCGDEEEEEEGKCDERHLVKKIRESLHHRRYLLVLDDLWSLEAWETIKFALPMDSNGSRIITTTRVQSVAKSCSSHWNDIVYEIRPLSTDDSRRLFYTRIFGSDTCPPHLVQVSEKIYKKFSGVPLAIKTISSLLATKARTEQEWWEVDNSLGNYGAGNTIFEGIASILHDYVITRDRLVMRWIAEGFIIEEPGRNLKELGESYFNELIERSFIQPVHVGCDGQPEYCRVHDLVHDFVVSKSAEENLAISLDLEDCQNLQDQHFKEIGSLLHLRLNKLQSLSIHGTDSSVDLLHRLYHPIRGLKKFQMNKDCYLSSIPEWLRSLPNLAYVCVDVKEVKNKDLQLLSCLPLLTYLSLSSRVVPTEKLAICSKGFLVLQEFHLHSAWANLTFEPGSMPKIERKGWSKKTGIWKDKFFKLADTFFAMESDIWCYIGFKPFLSYLLI
ncbi:hypothetical protein GUJ93_ZPchr0011g27454 [Zizania palustris]|uniref:NB-ARC domain-containing protein n=1 Tax=Zizania palustris TaxID=103762 RepID=A0A8J5WFL0_ZIZPA|nr:hypothetical protein GUJ93_ZPchr0011g27454 [Zizania palustris]